MIKQNRGFKIKPLDLLIIIIAGLGLFWVILSTYGGNNKPVLVISSGSDEWFYPLSENRTVAIKGILGDTVIKIENERASIISSPCNNKTCIASPPVKNPGDWSACLPNAVMIRVDNSSNKNELDAFSY